MPIITVLIVILIVGFIVWLINTYTPIDQKFKTLIVIVAIVFLIIWLLQMTGLLSGSFGPTVPRIR